MIAARTGVDEASRGAKRQRGVTARKAVRLVRGDGGDRGPPRRDMCRDGGGEARERLWNEAPKLEGHAHLVNALAGFEKKNYV